MLAETAVSVRLKYRGFDFGLGYYNNTTDNVVHETVQP